MNTASQRFAKLATMHETIFHAHDLANLWQIEDKNTLYTTLKRYNKEGLIFRIHKGLYALQPVLKLDPYLLGIKILHQYSYISTETILEKEGIVQQSSPYITLVSSKSKKFSAGANQYCSRQLSDKYLFQTCGIHDVNGIKMATSERAIADLLYFNPGAFLDSGHFVNWKKVIKLQKEIGYPVHKRYR